MVEKRQENRTEQITVRNKIDLSLSPDMLFQNPWADEGIAFLRSVDALWQPSEPATIVGFAASAHVEINKKITNFLRVTDQRKRFSQAIEFAAVPVLLDDVSYRKSFCSVRQKLMLSGASGIRLLNRYLWENENAQFDPAQELDGFFEQLQQQNADLSLPYLADDLPDDIPFAVECRNTFNYFHFVTESLAQLTVLDGLNFQGDVFFHYPNADEKQRPFVEGFVRALFPELEGRFSFERSPKEYEKVLTCYEFSGVPYQMPEMELQGLKRHVPRALSGSDDLKSFRSRTTLSMNSVSAALPALRRRGLAAVQNFDSSHLPKRFFVGRDDRQSRSRSMLNEELLFEHLELFGFEYVVFENLSPLEQIAIMSQAEIMISYHGAGFTNMLFANSDAWVIELGTLQTAQFRWGDFWQLANTAQCNYVSFFADFYTDTPELEPHFGDEGIVPVALSEKAVAQVMSFVVTVLGQYPQLKSRAALRQLTEEVFAAGAAEQALGLLETHGTLVNEDAELSLLKADCHKSLGEPKSELVALDHAYKADPTRWRTLIRMIWCANTCSRPQVIRWALSRLEKDFPERHDAFVGNHTWVRYVA